MTAEMGPPITFSREARTVMALAHFKELVSVLKSYEFEKFMGGTLVRREPIGVCGLITPWNWPLNQVTSKLALALAAGCTVVLKPSEIAPLSSILFGGILHDAGVPKGVFNLVNGDGATSRARPRRLWGRQSPERGRAGFRAVCDAMSRPLAGLVQFRKNRVRPHKLGLNKGSNCHEMVYIYNIFALAVIYCSIRCSSPIY
jgi:hypothetical protein